MKSEKINNNSPHPVVLAYDNLKRQNEDYLETSFEKEMGKLANFRYNHHMKIHQFVLFLFSISCF